MAVQMIDASGEIVALGFIDSHTHDNQAVLVQPDITAGLVLFRAQVACWDTDSDPRQMVAGVVLVRDECGWQVM